MKKSRMILKVLFVAFLGISLPSCNVTSVDDILSDDQKESINSVESTEGEEDPSGEGGSVRKEK